MILIVEDNPDDERLTLRALKGMSSKHSLVTLHDGDEASNYVRERSGPIPALVLLDLKVPKKSGFEILETIRSEAAWAHVPVVMLTSSSQPVDVVQAYRSGANSFVQKPVDCEEYLATIQTVGTYWTTKNVALVG